MESRLAGAATMDERVETAVIWCDDEDVAVRGVSENLGDGLFGQGDVLELVEFARHLLSE